MTARGAARWTSLALLAAVAIGAGCAGWIAPHPYAWQYRDQPAAGPSRRFPLGTDELGRDRFSRLLYGTRISLLLAPAAALISTAIAALFGCFAAVIGTRWERFAMACTDLLMAMPALLILLTVRALMPLNTSPWTSILVTCGLLGVLGWPPAARIVCAGIASLLNSDFVVQARSTGQSRLRIVFRHLLPNIRPILAAQFWILVPVFILSEANLSLLGLGVSEPLPSWGNMLRELENYSLVMDRPWVLAPLTALLLTVLCLHIVLPPGEEV